MSSKTDIVLGHAVFHEQARRILRLVISDGIAIAGQHHQDVVLDDPDAKCDVMHSGTPIVRPNLYHGDAANALRLHDERSGAFCNLNV
jgi:hypothetical protein